jgi:dTDP-4-dehydrorhamnose reductase
MKRGGSHLRIASLQVTWLIIGGTGQLGIALSRELGIRGKLYSSWGSRDLNIARAPNVLSAITNLKPSVIVNCAAWTDVDGAEDKEDEAYRVNADGAENVATAAKRCGAKLIHVSTDYVFSGESQSPWQVADEMNPQSAYGRTKAHGECRVLETYLENSLIVRTAWLYSPWRKNFAKTMTNLAIKGESEVKVVNDQVGQPTSATDLARKLVELGLSTSPAGVYHGTNSGQATWFDFAQEIFKLTGADVSRVLPVSSGEFPLSVKRPSFSVLSHDAWANTSIKPMTDWRMALAEVMPAIIFAVRAGE